MAELRQPLLLMLLLLLLAHLQSRQKTLPISWHSTTPTRTPTRPTRLQSYVRHTLFPREDPREEVGVGVGVVECELYSTPIRCVTPTACYANAEAISVTN